MTILDDLRKAFEQGLGGKPRRPGRRGARQGGRRRRQPTTQMERFVDIVSKLFGRRKLTRRDIEQAIELLAGLGIIAQPPPPRAGAPPTVPVPPPYVPSRPPGGPPSRPSRPARPPRPSRPQPAPTDPFDDDIITAEIVGEVEARAGGEPVDPKEASRKKQEAATVHVVQSSNVHSFYYVRNGRSGTLYVTFLSWTPGTKTRSGPGPTYAYFDVPVQKYLRFKSKAIGSSAGRAVWAYLRVLGKGNIARHQHQYSLTRVGPIGVRDTDAYVPRKVTRKGYKTRNLPDLSGRSQLQPREFRVPGNRARGVTARGVRRFI